MNKKNVIAIAVAAVIVAAGVLAAGAWMEHRKDQREEALAQSQVQVSEPEPTAAPEEEFVVEPTPEPVADEEELAEETSEGSDTTVVENPDGSVTADREWNKKPEDADIAQGGANLAGGGGDMPMDENGVYHGEPEPTAVPQPTVAPQPEQEQNTGRLPGFENVPDEGPSIGEESHGNGSDKIVGYM